MKEMCANKAMYAVNYDSRHKFHSIDNSVTKYRVLILSIGTSHYCCPTGFGGRFSGLRQYDKQADRK